MHIWIHTNQYDIRKLDKSDIEDVLDVMMHNPLYYQYCPPQPTRQSVAHDMKALPPRMTIEDKYYIGYYQEDQLVAVMDLILRFPNRETAFIGFFMMNHAVQGKGIGSEIIRECCKGLKEAGYRFIRLGYVKGNPQSEAFWIKNGFQPTGVEDVQERYTVVIMQKAL